MEEGVLMASPAVLYWRRLGTGQGPQRACRALHEETCKAAVGPCLLQVDQLSFPHEDTVTSCKTMRSFCVVTGSGAGGGTLSGVR